MKKILFVLVLTMLLATGCTKKEEEIVYSFPVQSSSTENQDTELTLYYNLSNGSFSPIPSVMDGPVVPIIIN